MLLLNVLKFKNDLREKILNGFMTDVLEKKRRRPSLKIKQLTRKYKTF